MNYYKPSFVRELKQGRFWQVDYRYDQYGSFTEYETEAGHRILIGRSPFGSMVWVNGKNIKWLRSLQIRGAIKKGMKIS